MLALTYIIFIETRRKQMTKLHSRIENSINKHAEFCGVFPEDFDKCDIKLISRASGIKAKYIWDYWNYWYENAA
jgi:hypothetical protein